MARTDTNASVKSSVRTLDIIELLVDQARPMLASEIAEALAIPMSSLSYLLGTLVDRQYLERRGRAYLPGVMLKRLGAARGRTPLSERVVPFVRALRNGTNETSVFFVREGFEVRALWSETGDHALRYSPQIDDLSPLHSFASGKALLSTLLAEDLSQYFADVERPKFTPTTLVTERALRDEIDRIRESGFAISIEENTPGVNAVATPVLINGRFLGALSVAIPTARYTSTSERQAMEVLERTTERLSAVAVSENWPEVMTEEES